jgi:2-polyprenyl-3-methyl-5-hydroxy-6-metoxy-1,4-benzoquinol methylase
MARAGVCGNWPGLGHLVAQLKTFQTYGGLEPLGRESIQPAINRTALETASAQDLPFADGSFHVVIIKHIVEHLPDPARALREIGRITAPGGTLILATPNLGSLLKPWKGERWIGYQDPTHISLKQPGEWLALIKEAGFSLKRVFADGFWDVPYIPLIPKQIQKLFFGSPGGFQAITGFVFLPMRWGESILVIARKNEENS